MTSIRPGERRDLDSIVRFQISMAKETEDVRLDPETLRNGVKAVFDDSTKGQYYVAVDPDGTTIGSLLITYEWSDWRNGSVWWIQSVWVEPGHRGRGLYRRLYEQVLSDARANGNVTGVRLYVDRRNERAREIYRHLGMDGEHYLVFESMNL